MITKICKMLVLLSLMVLYVTACSSALHTIPTATPSLLIQQSPDRKALSLILAEAGVTESEIQVEKDLEAWFDEGRAGTLKNNITFDENGKIIALAINSTKFDNLKLVSPLTELQWLQIKGNRIRRIEGLENLTRLEGLLLQGEITKIEGIDSLIHLRVLWLSGNQISKIENLEYVADTLEKLHLADNKIESISNLGEMPNLYKLDLRDNKITAIEGLENLNHLEMLSLSGNQISRIEGLGNLVGLLNLDLRNNPISTIEGLEYLTNLQGLYLDNCQIDKIAGLNTLDNLQELHLEQNNINQIEGLTELYRLRRLDLSENQISRIENLENLTNIQWLGLFGNQIVKVENLEKLNSLQTLHLGGNLIDMNDKANQEAVEDLRNRGVEVNVGD